MVGGLATTEETGKVPPGELDGDFVVELRRRGR